MNFSYPLSQETTPATSSLKGLKISAFTAMKLAIEEAQKGWGRVGHNPLVGCVIVDANHHFLASGYHSAWGEDHAEINALKKVDPSCLKGARFYVTLEPCAHQGKTPSCANTLSELPLQGVIFGLFDPNPLVAGKGAQILQQAGKEAFLFSDLNQLECSAVAQIQESLEELAEIFLLNMRSQKTFVSLKVASSLDGVIALNNGTSQWITNSLSREFNHYLRAGYDAVLVGRQTLQKDNPQLNVRHPLFPEKKNKVVILDPQGASLPYLTSYQITQVRPLSDIYYVVSEDLDTNLWSQKYPQLQFIKTFFSESSESPDQIQSHSIASPHLKKRDFSLPNLLSSLYSLGIKSLFVEGGAATLSRFLKERLAQRVYLFQAPLLLGGGSKEGSGLCWTEGLKTFSMDQALRLQNVQHLLLNGDIFTTGKLNDSK